MPCSVFSVFSVYFCDFNNRENPRFPHKIVIFLTFYFSPGLLHFFLILHIFYIYFTLLTFFNKIINIEIIIDFFQHLIPSGNPGK